MSAHRLATDLGIEPFVNPDLYSGNTTAGAGPITPYTKWSIQLLNSTAGVAEIRTLPDPVNSGTFLTLVMIQKTTSNLVVRASTPLVITTSESGLTGSNVTQLGQYINFQAINQSCVLMSIPCTKTAFVGSQTGSITNTTGYRWTLIQLDATSIT
jgi:hypothetical protein